MRTLDFMPYVNLEKQRQYQREWVARRRHQWFEQNGPCVDCGTWERLELDHDDAATKVDHRVWSWATERRLVELVKCVARCVPCHDRKTLARQEAARGVAAGRAKLTEQQVRNLRRAWADGENIVPLAEQLGIHKSTAYLITSGQTWKHVK